MKRIKRSVILIPLLLLSSCGDSPISKEQWDDVFSFENIAFHQNFLLTQDIAYSSENSEMNGLKAHSEFEVDNGSMHYKFTQSKNETTLAKGESYIYLTSRLGTKVSGKSVVINDDGSKERHEFSGIELSLMMLDVAGLFELDYDNFIHEVNKSYVKESFTIDGEATASEVLLIEKYDITFENNRPTHIDGSGKNLTYEVGLTVTEDYSKYGEINIPKDI